MLNFLVPAKEKIKRDFWGSQEDKEWTFEGERYVCLREGLERAS